MLSICNTQRRVQNNVFKRYFKYFICTQSRCCSRIAGVSTAAEKEKRLSYLHQVGTQPLMHITVGQTLSIAAAEYPDRECLVSVHENERYTFREMNEKVNQLASGFISSGLQQGDRIGIWSPNYSFWYIAMMAASKAGLIMTGINPGFQVKELEYCINKIGMKAIVAAETFKTQDYYSMLRELAPELGKSAPGHLKSSNVPSLSTVVIASDKNSFPGAYRFKDIFSLASNASDGELIHLNKSIKPDDAWSVQFSSGTTGNPKAAIVTHFGYINNSVICSRRFRFHEKPHRFCMQVPLFHAFGSLISLFGLLSKTTIILAGPNFTAENSLKAIEQEKCTGILGVPTMFVDLIAKQKELNYCLESLEFSFCGGSMMPALLYKQIKETLKIDKTLSAYGLTENCGLLTSSFIEDSDDLLLNTVGHVQDHAEVKVIDENGHIVPLGTPGELCIRSPATMLGYWGDKDTTAAVLGPDRWLKTGDLFILEANGYGKVVGRIKDVINRGGVKISSREIEDFIDAHPDVLETQVVAAPDERLGEEICAFVKVREGAKFDNDILKSFCKGKIAYFKIPKYLEVVESFPKTASGKVQKFKLREIISKKLNL